MAEWASKCSQTNITETVPSSSGGDSYEVNVVRSHDGDVVGNCQCKGFEYRGYCKHVTEVKSRICDWDSTISEEQQTPQQEMEAVCPRCGSETASYEVM